MELDDSIQKASEPKYDCLLFDLDDTLYPLNCGLALEVKKNIQDYMIQTLGIEEEKVPELCLSLYKFYGTTMAGLKAIGYNFDYDHFHSFVHGRLPYAILKPDPVLRNLLLSIPIRKLIFTNADDAHAAQVLDKLGLEGCFERIISFETLNPSNRANDPADAVDEQLGQNTVPSSEIFDMFNYCACSNSGLELPRTPIICKPSEEAFERVFKITNIDPQKTLFFDDSIRNLQTAKRLGLHTVWVGNSNRNEGVDFALEHIHNIREALPELWESADEKCEEMKCRQKVAIAAEA